MSFPFSSPNNHRHTYRSFEILNHFIVFFVVQVSYNNRAWAFSLSLVARCMANVTTVRKKAMSAALVVGKSECKSTSFF